MTQFNPPKVWTLLKHTFIPVQSCCPAMDWRPALSPNKGIRSSWTPRHQENKIKEWMRQEMLMKRLTERGSLVPIPVGSLHPPPFLNKQLFEFLHNFCLMFGMILLYFVSYWWMFLWLFWHPEVYLIFDNIRRLQPCFPHGFTGRCEDHPLHDTLMD